jgi:hypothetical protein
VASGGGRPQKSRRRMPPSCACARACKHKHATRPAGAALVPSTSRAGLSVTSSCRVGQPGLASYAGRVEGVSHAAQCTARRGNGGPIFVLLAATLPTILATLTSDRSGEMDPRGTRTWPDGRGMDLAAANLGAAAAAVVAVGTASSAKAATAAAAASSRGMACVGSRLRKDRRRRRGLGYACVLGVASAGEGLPGGGLHARLELVFFVFLESHEQGKERGELQDVSLSSPSPLPCLPLCVLSPPLPLPLPPRTHTPHKTSRGHATPPWPRPGEPAVPSSERGECVRVLVCEGFGGVGVGRAIRYSTHAYRRTLNRRCPLHTSGPADPAAPPGGL